MPKCHTFLKLNLMQPQTVSQGLSLAAALFLASAGLDLLGRWQGGKGWSLASRWGVRLGLVLLTATLVALGIAGFSSSAGIFASIAWGTAGLALFLDLTFGHRLPDWAVGLVAGLALLIATQLALTGGNLQPWITLHIAAAVLAYCTLIAQALNATAYLLQHHALSRHRFGGLYALLPSLVPLDRMGSQLLGAAVWMLGLALTIGAVAWSQGAAVALEKLVASGVAWVACLAVLVLRRRGKLAGTAFARASLLAFIPALVAFLLSLPRHG